MTSDISSDSQERETNPDFLHTVTMEDLYDTLYSGKTFIIEELLCSGTYLFVGAPKIGKSFFMAQMAYHVSAGVALWERSVTQGAVLYMALEDDYSRLQQRMSLMFGMETTGSLHFAVHARGVANGLEEQLEKQFEKQLEKFLNDYSDTRLVIIDTLQKVRDAGDDRGGYGSDYEIIAKLKHVADQHNICILIVHHTRKQGADDCFQTISGTTGLMGAADGAFMLHKEKRGNNQAVLDIVGRDQQDQRIYLEFDRECCLWNALRSEHENWKMPDEPTLELLSRLVNSECLQWEGTASALAEELEITDIKPNVLTRKLNIHVNHLLQKYKIQYRTSRSHEGRIIKLDYHP